MKTFTQQDILSNTKFTADALNITLHNGDTLEYLKTLRTGSVNLVVTSPPYNVGKAYETKTSIETYLETQEKIIEELIRVTNDNGSICWQVGNYVDKGEVFPLDIYYYNIFKKFNLYLRNRIIWRFGHGLHAKNRFSGRYETILWFTKTNNYTFNLDDVRVPSKYPGKKHFKGEKKGELSGNPKGKNPEDVWDILVKDWDELVWDIPNVKANHPEKTSHPCQFPVELIERLVLALTNPHDTVLDPFAGVASSMIAALKHNRNAIGIDKELQYIDIGIERIKSLFDGTLGLRPLGKEVHIPTGKEKISAIPEAWLNSDESIYSKK
ncbi:adenine-specific DNA-methyltransferase [Paenibacillus sp. V4I9]|uniref:DNA-methyltransferase n=1 Tax=Paenibacillus sp. V4I9 TaxID=3042308 RepID=UPI00277DAB5D|nr:site-specific DNA-methyltransferase [Paenibacillus sp. V4I9]MDQ0885003.1 adenine-specific DNA-methyltransferase [Paenibacillus sp. V4I9]